jgi:hypothetical protein
LPDWDPQRRSNDAGFQGRSDRPYDDAVGNDGFYRYKMRGENPDHDQNRALRAAMAERLRDPGVPRQEPDGATGPADGPSRSITT